MIAAMQPWMKIALVAGALLGVAGVVRWQAARHFVSEPPYRLLRRLAPDVELRAYAPAVLAETRVEAAWDDAPSPAFRRLAGYLFGGNVAPARRAGGGDATGGESLAMTAPVSQRTEQGAQVVAFFMPEGRDLGSLPVPRDPRVALREVPARTVAVLSYAGSARQADLDAQASRLRGVLDRAGLERLGEPTSARYDPPTTLPWLRRNEVWWEVRSAE